MQCLGEKPKDEQQIKYCIYGRSRRKKPLQEWTETEMRYISKPDQTRLEKKKEARGVCTQEATTASKGEFSREDIERRKRST